MDKSKTIILIIAALAALSLYSAPEQPQEVQQMYQIKIEWENFKIKHSRNYQSIEQEAYRFKVFKDNLEMIKKHNADSTKTYKMRMNHFGDLTEEEFSQKVLTPNLKNMKKNTNIEIVESKSNLRSSPASVDWRGKGVVTSVKNQGMCGSCWAFSTAGALEAVVAMKNKTLNDYSEQQLVDCCSYSKYGCEGCSGSWPEWAMEYVKDSGIMLDKDYPYTAVQDKCKGTATAVKILDHKKAWSQLSNNTETVKETLATFGPLSISVDAYRWQFYVSGIFNDCHDAEVDHSVLLVGYQEDGTWIVKNSWSDAWGEQGYIRIANKGSACLIKNHIIIPHLAA